MDCGVIYIATGESYVKEAAFSAQSLKRHMPDMPVTLFTAEDVTGLPEVSDFFDRVIVAEAPQYNLRDRIVLLGKSPYERTLFLDTDTYICAELSELFTLLDQFDFAAAHAPSRHAYPVNGVPESFPEFNAGVLVYKNSASMRDFFVRWQNTYDEAASKMFPKSKKGIWSQPSFREVSYYSSLKIATLPPEYNYRLSSRGISAGYLHGKAKIIHGRHPDLSHCEKILNAQTGRRVHLMNNGKIRMLSPGKTSKSFELLKSKLFGILKGIFRSQQIPKQEKKAASSNPQIELISLHIPKTAGTSFRNILKSVYGENGVVRVDIPLRSEAAAHENKITGPENLSCETRVIHGHFCFQDLVKTYKLSDKIPLITWVRDPVERVISNYFYLHKILKGILQEEKRNINILAKMERSLIEYARFEGARNRMAKFLGGIPLEKFIFIGVQEFFLEDLKELASILQWKGYQDYSDNSSEDAKSVVSKELREEIRLLNLEDVRLYEKVLKLREKRLEQRNVFA